MVVTLDEQIKSEMEVSANWCITINTRDLASTLVNYQASYCKVITSLKYIKYQKK